MSLFQFLLITCVVLLFELIFLLDSQLKNHQNPNFIQLKQLYYKDFLFLTQMFDEKILYESIHCSSQKIVLLGNRLSQCIALLLTTKDLYSKLLNHQTKSIHCLKLILHTSSNNMLTNIDLVTLYTTFLLEFSERKKGNAHLASQSFL